MKLPFALEGGVPVEARDTLGMDDELASDLGRALCLLAARSETSHPEGQLAPGQPTAILISGDFGDLVVQIWLSRANSSCSAAVYGTVLELVPIAPAGRNVTHG